MKKLVLILSIFVLLVSCKMLLKGAAKYWSKKQVKEFLENCEANSSKLMSDDKAKEYCDCAVDIVAEKYQNFEDVKKMGFLEALKIAKDCK